MPRAVPPPRGEAPPTHFAPSVPDANSAQPFVFTQLMELSAAFARVEQKVDNLAETVKELDNSVDGLKHTASTAKGVLIVFGVLFTLALALVGWLVAGDVRISVGKDEPALVQPRASPASTAAVDTQQKQEKPATPVG